MVQFSISDHRLDHACVTTSDMEDLAKRKLTAREHRMRASRIQDVESWWDSLASKESRGADVAKPRQRSKGVDMEDAEKMETARSSRT